MEAALTKGGSPILSFFAWLVLILAFLVTLYFLLPSRWLQRLIGRASLPFKLLRKAKTFFLYSIPFLLAFHVKLCFIERLEIQGDSMMPSLAEGEKIWIEKFTTGIGIPPLAFPFSFALPPKLFSEGLLPFKRGDIVVFFYPGLEDQSLADSHSREELLEDEGELPSSPLSERKIFVKRVIALANEEYSFHNGKVYINHKPLKEPYLAPGLETPPYPEIDPLARNLIPEELNRLGLLFSYAAQYGLPPKGKVPKGSLLVLGDKRESSGDSRTFGFLPVSYVIGKVIFLTQ